MPRKPSGKPLALFPVRVDEDVKAVLLEMKNKHTTINAGLRKALVNEHPPVVTAVVEGLTPEIEKRIAAQVKPRIDPSSVSTKGEVRKVMRQAFPRASRIREKGDKTR